jgi:hypothetical protein
VPSRQLRDAENARSGTRGHPSPPLTTRALASMTTLTGRPLCGPSLADEQRRGGGLEVKAPHRVSGVSGRISRRKKGACPERRRPTSARWCVWGVCEELISETTMAPIHYSQSQVQMKKGFTPQRQWPKIGYCASGVCSATVTVVPSPGRTGPTGKGDGVARAVWRAS